MPEKAAEDAATLREIVLHFCYGTWPPECLQTYSIVVVLGDINKDLFRYRWGGS